MPGVPVAELQKRVPIMFWNFGRISVSDPRPVS
jgi:hypothetical protein